MKRLLIFSILLSFVTVSCAGPNKGGWTKIDFRQDEFEKDKKECIQTLEDPEASETGVSDCLAKKGYHYYQTPESHQTPESNTLKDLKDGVILIALIAGFPILIVLQLGCFLFYGIWVKDEPNPCSFS
jgi:hypothetical protein